MQLITNADDFGRTREINAAVIEAHLTGTLTSASLMVNAGAWENAVELCRQTPSLAVGLHVTTIDGATATGAALGKLVDSGGVLPPGPVRLGRAYALSAAHRRAIRAEIEAQFARFASTGLPLSHVDGHWNFHLHPALADIILPLAARHGAAGVRVVREMPLFPSGGFSACTLPQAALAATFRMLSARLARHARAVGLATPRASFGLAASGHMEEKTVLEALDYINNTGAASAEFVFHPTTGPRLNDLGPNPGDLAALLSTAVRRRLELGDIVLSRYHDLAKTGTHDGHAAGDDTAGHNGDKLGLLGSGDVVRAPNAGSQGTSRPAAGAAVAPDATGALPPHGVHPQAVERRG